MKNIFSGTFEQVEDKVNKDFAKNVYINFAQVKSAAVIPLILFFVGGGVYGIYALGWYIAHHMNNLTVSLDHNNEYKIFFNSMWYVHLIALLFIARLITLLSLKNRKRSAAFYYGQVLTIIFLTLWYALAFVVSEIFIANAVLRTIYTILFILALIFTFWQAYQNAKKLVFDQCNQTNLQRWVDKNKGWIMSLIGAIGGLSFLLKNMFQPIGDFETRLMGALMDYFPLLLTIAYIFVILYLTPAAMKAYYMHKYSEEFRQKFEVDRKDWYGPEAPGQG